MIAAVGRVIAGSIATLGMFAAFAVVLPLVAMAIALYLARLWPLTKRRD